jgi:hypothetical protein
MEFTPGQNYLSKRELHVFLFFEIIFVKVTCNFGSIDKSKLSESPSALLLIVELLQSPNFQVDLIASGNSKLPILK